MVSCWPFRLARKTLVRRLVRSTIESGVDARGWKSAGTMRPSSASTRGRKRDPRRRVECVCHPSDHMAMRRLLRCRESETGDGSPDAGPAVLPRRGGQWDEVEAAEGPAAQAPAAGELHDEIGHPVVVVVDQHQPHPE